ncbi:MAG TPA: ABC transporter ATP-binding protein [Flavobacterium sp.]|nr:ABC transporter ATP-binding protein [Flavobacterium sp.]
MNQLVAQNLTIGYKNKDILCDLSFELRTGVLTSLLGSNGIGKSTLLKTIARLIESKKGLITIDGKDSKTFTNSDFSQQISLVLTHEDVNQELSVYELVKLGRQPYTNWMDQLTEEDKSLIEETLIACEITDLRDRKISQLSDGQLQRCFIARAVVQDTPFILLDEPSTHLDLYHKMHLFKLLKKLCIQKNKCILFSTHDLDLALQLSDEIMLLKDEKLYHNTTEELINQGVFDRFFDSDDIVFDKERKQFTIL